VQNLVSDISEKRRLRVFVNRVLRLFGSKRGEVTGCWRELHNGELHNLHCLPHCQIELYDQVEDEMGKTCSTNARRLLVGNSEGKRPLRRQRRERMDNIKMDLIKNWVIWTELIWLRIWTGDRPSDTMKC
jgi:hypothetical protein